MKIVNFGSCNIDYVYRLDHIVSVGETERSELLELFPGGKGLNQSIAAAKAGAEVFHAGIIGKDGQLLYDTLLESGVAMDHLRVADTQSGHAIIQVSEKGENSIVIYAGANGLFTEEYIDGVLENFSAGDLLILQNEINNIGYIARKGHDRGMKILFNPSPIDADLAHFDFSTVTYLILNEIEGEYLSGQQAAILAALSARYPHLKVLLTLGEQGCVYKDGERIYTHSAYHVSVVDSTAAGDTFTGYFAAGLAAGLSPEKILQRACAASALSVSKKGAAPSIPMAAEVMAALPTLKKRTVGNGKEELLRQKIVAYFGEHLQDASLSGLAEKLGYSEVYAGHLLKKMTEKSFSRYLQERRCAEAARLLTESALPISEIIACVGYQNESFFREKFKEIYGVSPLKYRKNSH